MQTEEKRAYHRAYMRRWRKLPDNAEKDHARQKRWHLANRRHLADYKRERLAVDENFRIRTLLAKALHVALVKQRSGNDWRPNAKLRGIVGCSKPAMIAHIEAQFLPGMSWSNYGRKGWEIDHIKPCASFDLTQHDQVLLCFHYTNLRPLWRADNNRRQRKE